MDETRARIIAAAKDIYEQNGTRGTTTRLVAERAGVNEATLFRHFGSKHLLLSAMREEACPLAFVESVLATLCGNLREDLGTLAMSMVTRMHAQRAMLCIAMAEDARGDIVHCDPEWRGPMQFMQLLEAYFAQQITLGHIHGDAKRLATFFMGMCFSYVVARKIWNSYLIKSDDLNLMVDLFLNGAH